MLVIGDEILSGRTRDANAHHLACEMTRIGVELVEVRMVRDEQGAIVAAVNALQGRGRPRVHLGRHRADA